MIAINEAACFSLPCIGKTKNEDYILAPIQNEQGDIFFAIADGVGSLEGSDEASRLVISNMLRSINDTSFSIPRMFKEAHESVVNANSNIATTLTMVHINDTFLSIGHIGDCRAYFMLDSKLKQMTTDHTKYNDLISSGEFKPYQLRNHKQRLSSVLTSAISKESELKFDLLSFPIEEIINDGFLFVYLMSDGAYHHWDKRKRFSDKTMHSPSSFSASLKKRIEKNIIDDYSFIGVKISVS